VVELVVAGLLAAGGARSLIRWMRAEFDPVSAGEQALYTLYRTARVGMWFAFAGFFAGYALVEDPGQFRWYIFVPIGLSGIQLLTGVMLGRSGAGRPPPPDGRAGPESERRP
jgi:hypothetical protein